MKRLKELAQRRPLTSAFFAFALVGLSIGLDAPWTDDARFYVPATASYATWFGRAVTFDTDAWSRAAIDRAFTPNHEHPPVAKYVMGLGWLLFHQGFGVDEVTACRIPVALLWALTAALVFELVRRRASLIAGIFASCAFATLPRVFFDGHAETLDLPVTAFITASLFWLLEDFEAPSRKKALAAVGLFTLALGTKLNAPFALAAAGLFWLAWKRPRKDGTLLVLERIPWSLVGMATLAPLLCIALWPWLWFDTAARLSAYVHFHLTHYGILFYYGGRIYQDDVAPATAPFVMTAMTLPLPVLAMSLYGATRLREGLRSPVGRLALYALLTALLQLAAVASPGTPVYGGVKLFLPAFPFIAVLAGLGFDLVRHELETVAHKRVLIGALACLLLLPGALGLWLYRGAWLSYYAEWAGGVRGAAEGGYETQYYDLAYDDLATDLARLLPNGGSVAVLPNPKEYAPYLKRWQALGRLRGVTLGTPENADVLVLTHERRWPRYPELMSSYRNQPLRARKEILGVPLYSIYGLR